MTGPKILALVQAGGAGGRMDVLTAENAKPALRFAGCYRLIDFVLSNLMHSAISDVWVSVAYQAGAVADALRNGRPWDLDRTYGGLAIVAQQEGFTTHESGSSAGNADELFMLRDRIRAHGADLVLVLSADHAYRVDYRALIETHVSKGAEATVLSTDISDLHGAVASDHGVLEVNRLGRVTGFEYKPERPLGTEVAVEAIDYSAASLIEELEESHREINATGEDGLETPGLGDFGERLIPRLVARGRTYRHRLDGYWRDLGQPHHYLNAHLELVRDETDLFSRAWPVVGHQPQMLPARIDAQAELHESLVSPGCVIGGSVTRSVLSPGVVVEPGATLVECVVGDGVVVRSGARAFRSILDAGAELRSGALVGSADADLSDADAIAIVGRDSVVDSHIGAGARLYPGSSA